MRVAILLTCFNRKDKTLNCLENMQLAIDYLQKYKFDTFLVDDASTDATKEAVKQDFKEVNVILGSGDLYWNQGMKLAWNTALENDDYDFYIWLNDDTMVDKDAIFHILACYNELLLLNRKPVIVVGACRSINNGSDFSYGLRDETGPLLPNGNIQYGKYMNGNLVLVPTEIVDKLGILSDDYTHAMGDFDYGLRTLKYGFRIITTKKYIATCHVNTNIPIWRNSKKSLLERWKSFHSPLGLNIKEYKVFCNKFWPEQYYRLVIKAYIKFLLPSLYTYFSNEINHINRK